MNIHRTIWTAFAVLLTVCWLTPSPAQQLHRATEVNLGEGPEDIIARELWYTQQRVAEDEEAPWEKRLAAWGKVREMSVYRPHVLNKSGNAASSSWVCLGPRNRGGRVTGIAVHPLNPDIVYMTAANGGVWKSIDGGTSLIPIADHLPTLAMGAIAIDPTDPDIVWAGTGEANVWTYSYPGMGIFKSTDAGATWVSTAWFGSTRVSAMRVHPENGNIVFAATLKGLVRTTDSGGAWTTVLPGEVYELMLHPGDAATWYAGVRLKGIFKSTDTGETWEYLSQQWEDSLGLALNQIGRIAFDCCKAKPDVMYATIVKVSGNNLYAMLKSTDGGRNWQRIAEPQYNVFNSQGFYNCDLAVDPQNPDRVLLGGILIYQTLDGGQTWTFRSPSHADQHALEFAPSNPKIFYAGHDGGFNRSTDGGASYDALIHIMPITQYYDIDISYLNPDVILGGTQDNGSHLGSAISPDWKKATGSDGAVCIIDYENPAIMYTEMQLGQNHWRTLDSGKTWKSIITGIEGTGAWITPVVMHPRDPAILFTATNTHLYKTTNRGDVWFKLAERVVPDRGIQEIAISPADPSRMAVGYSGDGGIALSADGGATWAPGPKIFTAVITDMEFHATDPDRIYVTCSGYSNKNIRMSTDGGATWEILNGNLPSTPVNTIALNPSNDSVIWIGTDLSVFVTTNLGTTWELLGDGMPFVSVQDLVHHAPSGRLFAATHGRGIYELTASTPVETSSFSVRREGSTVVLGWLIPRTRAFTGFAIERKTRYAETWIEIGYVEATGCIGGTCPYAFADSDPPVHAGSVLYRLRMLRKDGSYVYSQELYLALGADFPRVFALDQNYPNPAHAITTFRYTVPEAGRVRLEITNAQGIRVAVLAEQFEYSGSYALPFDLSTLAEGVYFYHLYVDGHKKLTRKMMVLR